MANELLHNTHFWWHHLQTLTDCRPKTAWGRRPLVKIYGLVQTQNSRIHICLCYVVMSGHPKWRGQCRRREWR